MGNREFGRALPCFWVSSVGGSGFVSCFFFVFISPSLHIYLPRASSAFVIVPAVRENSKRALHLPLPLRAVTDEKSHQGLPGALSLSSEGPAKRPVSNLSRRSRWIVV